MTRQRPRKPETIIARLLRLGTLSEIDSATGRRIAWSDDVRRLAGGDRDDRETTRPRPPTLRPSLEELIAREVFEAPDWFARRELAILELFRDVGIVDAVETDPANVAIRVKLSEPYRRLIEAGREPDREPGFDAAWDSGGPSAVRTWLEVEARKVGWTGEAVVPELKRDRDFAGTQPAEEEDFSTLPDLLEVAYGAEISNFMFTPHDSLDGRTPAAALGDGDVRTVWEIVLKDARGGTD